MTTQLMFTEADVAYEWREGLLRGLAISLKNPDGAVELSLVEAIEVELNGERFGWDELSFTLRDETYSAGLMATLTTTRWEYGERAILHVPYTYIKYGSMHICLTLRFCGGMRGPLSFTKELCVDSMRLSLTKGN